MFWCFEEKMDDIENDVQL
ncbi:hypothetical protein LINPERHAP1_LOCUS36583 [Linum perenne]